MKILKKDRITSVSEIKRTIGDFKRSAPAVITNYVPDQKLHADWVGSGHTVAYTFINGIFISYDNGFMLETVFITASGENFRECLEEIGRESGKPVVAEHVVREDKDNGMPIPDRILRRMSRCGDFGEMSFSTDRVESACPEDISKIRNIFNSYFDPLTERLPDAEAIKELIDRKGISIIRQDDKIIGMVIYEKNLSSIHLRYWWVSPEHRDMGIGSELLRDYFQSGKECRRQFLWVFSDNEDAIRKYRHYGFEFDGTSDNIYVIKDNHNGR